MNKVKVVEIDREEIIFDNDLSLCSEHMQDCCEQHYLNFADLTLDDFEGLEFDLTTDDFFSRIEGYGIQLNPIVGFPVRVAAYSDNNGYYSSNLSLVLMDRNRTLKTFDITECQ